MTELRITLETVTPLFLGGADPRGQPELRAASVRGALRFWLRALVGGVIGDRNLDPLREAETQVFGDTESGSPIVVRIRHGPLKTESFSKIAGWDNAARNYRKLGVAYLLFAARRTRTEPERNAISAGCSFELMLHPRAGVKDAARDDALRKGCVALWLLTHLGGIGSRSRRGGGNMQVANVQGQLPSDLPDLQVRAESTQQLRDELANGLKQLRTLISTGSPTATISPTPNFDVLHPNACRIVVLNRTWNTWDQALDEVGHQLQTFRNCRPPDYQNVKDVLTGTSHTLQRVERAAFGLPMVFYYRSLKGQQGILEGSAHDRRASPLFIRVMRLANGQHTVVMTVFKAALLEGSEGLVLKQGTRVLAKAPAPTLGLIDTFLSSLGISLLEVKNW